MYYRFKLHSVGRLTKTRTCPVVTVVLTVKGDIGHIENATTIVLEAPKILLGQGDVSVDDSPRRTRLH